ncbi:hypothetical protein LMG26858_03248 [Achromobacter anxifer]|uniref:Uncharacterized protein n=1 Tax=Achromobacter anxifer TaxID=1287737 RepID=A0A6S7DFI2_9BURK|nr:hypothetical protein LMG26858_03248 [Achromobacter anxifer]
MQPGLRLGFVAGIWQRDIARQTGMGRERLRFGSLRIQVRPVLAQGASLHGHGHQRVRGGGRTAGACRLRIGLVLAFPREIQAGRQEARHVPVHEEAQRSGGQALAPVQLPSRFLPLQAREIHPAGVTPMAAGDVRALVRQDRPAGFCRQHLQQRLSQPQHVARAAQQAPVLPDAGVEFAVQVDGIQRRRAQPGAHLLDLAEQLGSVGFLQADAILRAGRARRERQPQHRPARERQGQGQRRGGHA